MTRLPTLRWLLALLAISAQAHDGAACQSNPPPAVVSGRAALARTPASLETRLTLADALVEATCYDEAVHTLEEGEGIHPRNADLQAKLRTTRSLVSEETYFAGLEQAEVAARVSRNLLRCSRLGDLNACDEALKLKPNDVDILIAKGDAQLAAGKPADAEATYRRAQLLAPDHARLATQLATARTQRGVALSNCQKGTADAALTACQAALLRGADDEFEIYSRLAQLYQQRNEPAAALSAYMAAQSLQRGDRNVALGIVALTDADGHRDAVASAARGSALVTLGRGKEALAALKQAQSLAPTLPDLRAQIAQAEKISRTEVRPGATGAASGTTPAPVRLAETGATSAARRYSNDAQPTRSN